MNYHIKQEHWKKILSILENIKGLHVKNIEKLQKFIEGICYRLKTGCQWRMLPSCYGHWRKIHQRFMRWSQKGILEKIFNSVKVNPDTESVMIDATIVRAHSCASGYEKDGNEKHALGRSKGGFTTKIHVQVDALGMPLKLLLSAGNCHDIVMAPELVSDVQNSMVIADKGYDSDDFVALLQEQKCQVCIPPRQNRNNPRDYDVFIYKERHLVECFLGKLKWFRGVFSRFDKTASSYLSFLHLASALIWMR